MNFNERPIIITDIETTGLNSSIHEIIEIGAIKVNKDLEEIDRFDYKIIMEHPDRANKKALEINGYTPELWFNADWRKPIMILFSKFSENGILCAWNITFEYSFLNAAFQETGVLDKMDYHRIDIPSIVWSKNPNIAKLGLDYVAQEFGLPPEPKPHRGITGAEYELSVLRSLRGR